MTVFLVNDTVYRKKSNIFLKYYTKKLVILASNFLHLGQREKIVPSKKYK